MTRPPKYILREPINSICFHDVLPLGVKELGCLNDSSSGGGDVYTLVANEKHLSILVSYHAGPNKQYYCKQYDFPLKVLSWFPKALDGFRKPPVDGGLHAGAMISKDVDVDGEMLAVGSTTSGYALTNWSRNRQGSKSIYEPVEISLSWTFLYDLGFLDLWKTLGDKLERGEV